MDYPAIEQLITISHTFSTLFMCGLCWFVQIVHYPLMHEIDPKSFSNYEKKNLRTAYIAAPVMTFELITGAALLYFNQESLLFINLALMTLIWLSTFIFQGPTHLALTKGYDSTLVQKLIHTNWIRTIGWTIKSGLLFLWLI